MRLREVFRYELEYRARSISTWVYAAFLFGIVFWGIAATSGGGDPVFANAPKEIAQTVVLFGGTFGILISAALFADAAIRDVAAGMEPLLYTTRLHTAEYLGGRFLAALVTNAVLAMAIPVGFFVATQTIVDPAALGPHRLAAYAQPMLLFILPNLVLVGTILFAIAVFARQAIPVYLGAAAIFIGNIVAANYWNDIANPIVSALADPLGINALLATMRYWTPTESNARLIGFPTLLVWNRLLWLAIAAGLFAVVNRTFRFAHVADGGLRRRRRLTAAAAPTETRWAGAVPQLTGVFGAGTRLRQTFAVARASLAEVVSGRAFRVVLVASIGLVLLWGWNVGDTVFDTSVWPVTHLVLGTVLSERASFMPWLVIALYAGELVWNDREVGVSEIADAVPVPTGILLLGRFLALVAIITAYQGALMVGGILLQSLHGYYTFELGLYVRVLFGLKMAELVILAALAMTIHVIVNQKYVGYIVVLLGSAFPVYAGFVGLHNLLVYNGAPRWRYSDMNGFGPFVTPFIWFKLYWAAWALLLGVIAVLFWIRGRESGVRTRLTSARARFVGSTARVAGLAAALIVALGGFVFYNTNVLNTYRTRETAGLPRAEYERRYKRFEHAPQPVMTAADLRVELHPDEPAVELSGSYRLVNRTGVAIDSVHVVVDPDLRVRAMSLDRAAKPSLVDDGSGYRIFMLERPLAPGDSVRLRFDAAFRPRGFPNSGMQIRVVGNGSYFDRTWLPFIGYQPIFELTDHKERERFGLTKARPMAEPNDAAARQAFSPVRNEDHVRLDVVVGTSVDQTAVVPGVLRRSWMQKGRRYFHYGSADTTTFGGSVFSAKYATRQDKWIPAADAGQAAHAVAIDILHHPAHRDNVDQMLAAAKAALGYYTSAFGPYPYDRLRIVEIPPYHFNGGRAFPSAVAFAENVFITRDRKGEVDQTFFGTAHEIAHTWWGGQARAANAKGRGFVAESMSNYSAMMVTETVLGADELRRVYDFQMDRYLGRRSAFATDVPLIEVEDHPHIEYGKGAVAMYSLREAIGADAVNSALRRFLEKYPNTGPPYPTSLDLVSELRAVTPDSLGYLITDLFETVTLWDVKTERAVMSRKATGEYEVTLDVVGRKVRADSVGKETDTPMDDVVEIGVFGAGKDGAPGEPLYLTRHRIHTGTQRITVTVSKEPSRAGVDPYRKLIDRDRADNVVGVVTGAASPD